MRAIVAMVVVMVVMVVVVVAMMVVVVVMVVVKAMVGTLLDSLPYQCYEGALFLAVRVARAFEKPVKLMVDARWSQPGARAAWVAMTLASARERLPARRSRHRPCRHHPGPRLRAAETAWNHRDRARSP